MDVLFYYEETNQFKVVKPCDTLLKKFTNIAIEETVNIGLFLLGDNRLYRLT